jgi:hypothetical protein
LVDIDTDADADADADTDTDTDAAADAAAYIGNDQQSNVDDSSSLVSTQLLIDLEIKRCVSCPMKTASDTKVCQTPVQECFDI